LVKGSVRSLPKGQMQDFRRLFEQKDAEVGKIAQQGTPKSYVQATGAKFETCSEDSSVGDEPKIRHKSPVKLTTPKQYPNQYTNYPLPSPRKKVENMDVPNTENCVSKLPLAKFGKICRHHERKWKIRMYQIQTINWRIVCQNYLLQSLEK